MINKEKTNPNKTARIVGVLFPIRPQELWEYYS
jgi:hypothetical protein